jgi:hypothetical protein
MREISVYLNNFNSHRKSYVKIQNSLICLYQDYTNSEVIISLCEYWLFSISTLHQSYGNKGLDEFLLRRNNDPISYSYFYEFGIIEAPPHDINTKKKFIFRIDKYLPMQYRLPSAPSTGFFSSLLARHTKLLASQLPRDSDKNLVVKITEIIYLYLLHMGIKVDKSLINQNIPDVFKSKQIKCNNLREVRLDGAPIEIMQFKGYECILLLNRKIDIFGYQHGGGYDIVHNDPLTYFEKKVSNRFIGWGFSKENSHQTRYVANQNIDGEIKKIRKVIWIESSRDSKFISYCYPVLFDVKNGSEIPKYIHSELIECGVEYFNKKYPGKLESNRYKGMRGPVIPSDLVAENILVRGDIVIFDNCMHSLIYYCLENNILFLIVDKKDVTQYYTYKMFLWYKILRRNKLIFHLDEKGALSERITNLNFRISLPDEVCKYYKNVFS